MFLLFPRVNPNNPASGNTNTQMAFSPEQLMHQQLQQQLSLPQQYFQNFQNQEQVYGQIAYLASPIANPNPMLGGYSKFQVWMDMFKNPGNHMGGPMYYQSIKQDPDLQRLILGILASPFSNQNVNDGQLRYAMNQGIQWFTNFVVNCANGMPQFSDKNGDRFGNLGDLIAVVSQASYSGIRQLPAFGG